MSDNYGASCNQDIRLENFAAELTRAAYGVALRHGTAGTWVDLELDLWKALTDTVKKWGRGSPPPSEVAFACDWAEGQPEAETAMVVMDSAPWREARQPFSGE
jgi:hypothetical protein